MHRGKRLAVSVLMLLASTLVSCHVVPRFPDVEDGAELGPAEVLLYAGSARDDTLGRLVVPVQINASGPYYFLLDTGATHSVLSGHIAKQLGLVINDRLQFSVRGVNGVKRASTVIIDEFSAGAIRHQQWRLPVLSGSIMDDVDGILGSDVLRDVRLNADFVSNQVRISDTQGQKLEGRAVMDFTSISRNLAAIDVYIGRVRAKAVLDTGGVHTLANIALLRALVAQAGGRIQGLGAVAILDATDTSKGALQVTVPRMRFGKVAINDLPVAFGAFPVFDSWGINDRPALLLGMDVLGSMQQLTVDYQRKELLVVPQSR